jgi:hypothetical protein
MTGSRNGRYQADIKLAFDIFLRRNSQPAGLFTPVFVERMANMSGIFP